MRQWAALIAWLATAAAATAASTNTVHFQLFKFTNRTTTNRTVTSTPLTLYPGPGQQAIYDRVQFTTSTNGEFWASNMMYGLYQIVVEAPPDRTTFKIYTPATNAIAVLEADAIMVAATNAANSPQSFAYSMQASDARYTPIGGVVIGNLSPWNTNINANTFSLSNATAVQAAAFYGDGSALNSGSLTNGASVTNVHFHSTVSAASGATNVIDLQTVGGAAYGATNHSAVVLGGKNNVAGGIYSVVVGGYKNQALGSYGFIGNGSDNGSAIAATALNGAIVNGQDCSIMSGNYGFIGAGVDNTTAAGNYNFVGNGFNCTLWGDSGFIGDGLSNHVGGFVGTGYQNWIGAIPAESRLYSSVLNGWRNQVNGDFSTILGGANNFVGANYSAVLGGTNNLVTGTNSYALGSGLTVLENNTTVVENLASRGSVSGEGSGLTALNPVNLIGVQAGTAEFLRVDGTWAIPTIGQQGSATNLTPWNTNIEAALYSLNNASNISARYFYGNGRWITNVANATNATKVVAPDAEDVTVITTGSGNVVWNPSGSPGWTFSGEITADNYNGDGFTLTNLDPRNLNPMYQVPLTNLLGVALKTNTSMYVATNAALTIKRTDGTTFLGVTVAADGQTTMAVNYPSLTGAIVKNAPVLGSYIEFEDPSDPNSPGFWNYDQAQFGTTAALSVGPISTYDGSRIEGLNATNLASGTVPLARLSGINSNNLDAPTKAQLALAGGGLATNVPILVAGDNVTIVVSGLSNTISATGSGTGQTNWPAGAITNAPWFGRVFYVSPSGNDATAVIGDISHPYKTLFDFDGATRSGVCTLAGRNDTIMLMGTNAAWVVPLESGVTLRGWDVNTWLVFTNGNGFTNDWVLARGGKNLPQGPFLALNGDDITVENLRVDLRDGSVGTNDANINFISLVAQSGPSSVYIVTNSPQPELYRPIPSYERLQTNWMRFGFTNMPGTNLVFRASEFYGNVDVFYVEWWVSTKWYAGSTNDPSWDGVSFLEPLESFELLSSWATNTITTERRISILIDRCRLKTYWDILMNNGDGVRVVLRDVEGISTGYPNGTGYGIGINGSATYSDYGGRYYLGNVTPTNNTFGVFADAAEIAQGYIGGRVSLSGTVFYQSNLAASLMLARPSGTYYDEFRRTAYVVGGTNTIVGDGTSTGSGTGDATLAGTNVWTGTNTYTQPTVFSNTVSFYGDAEFFGTSGTTTVSNLTVTGEMVATNATFRGATNQDIHFEGDGEYNIGSPSHRAKVVYAADSFTGPGGGLTNIPATAIVVAGSGTSLVLTQGHAVAVTLPGGINGGPSYLTNVTLKASGSANAKMVFNADGSIQWYRAVDGSQVGTYSTDGAWSARSFLQGAGKGVDASGNILGVAGTFSGAITSSSLTATNGLTLPGTNAVIKFTPKAVGSNGIPLLVTGLEAAYIYAITNAVSGEAELWTVDGSGDHTLISPHSKEAPPELYDADDPFVEHVSKEVNVYLGLIRWINYSRGPRQQELLTKIALNSRENWRFLTGKSDSQWTNAAAYSKYTNALQKLDAMTEGARQLVVTETFAEYEARTGVHLEQVSWTAVQARLSNEVWTAYLAAGAAYASALEAYLTAVDAGDTNAVLPVEPIYVPRVAEPVPQWLYKRGVR